MNGWTAAATALFAGGVGSTAVGVATGPLRRRVVAQNLSTALACPGLLLLAQGYDRPSYVDLALILALLGPVGTLVFARLLAHDLAGDPPGGRVPTLAAAAVGAVVVPVVCAAGETGRPTVKLLIVGVLLIAGNLVASRALSHGFRTTTPARETSGNQEPDSARGTSGQDGTTRDDTQDRSPHDRPEGNDHG